jgi:transcriptional regulator with XRE-family HTH domain
VAVQSPTVRRRRLGQELRRLREGKGLTCEEVGERLEWSGAKVSRIETARVKVSVRDVRDLLDLYGISEGKHRENMLLLTREAHQRAWWESYVGAVEPTMLTLVGLEVEAIALQAFDVQVINGLLQSEEYARAVLRAVARGSGTDQMERAVALRMKRQEALMREQPLQVWSVMDEAVLRRQVGGADVLRSQLGHLLDMAELPQVTLQVLPFSAGAHVGVDSAFSVLEMPPPDPEIVHIEHFVGIAYLDTEHEVRQYTRMFDRLRATAMSPDDSIKFIAQLKDRTIEQ